MSDTTIITKDVRASRVGQEPALRDGQARGPRFERRRNMRIVAEPLHPRDPPAGSVDLRSLHYSPEAAGEWGMGTRVQDVITTVNAAIDEIADCFVEVIGEANGDLGKELDALAARVDEITRRLERSEFENATLKREVELLGKCIGSQPSKAASAKPKARRKSSDVSSLPDFVVRTAAPKRKSRSSTIDAAPSAETAP